MGEGGLGGFRAFLCLRSQGFTVSGIGLKEFWGLLGLGLPRPGRPK